MRRAQYVRLVSSIWSLETWSDCHSSQLLSRHEIGTLLDEEMTIDERAELQSAEEVCRRFLGHNLEADRDVSAKELLAQVLGRVNNIGMSMSP